MAHSESRLVVYAALSANMLIAAAKFAAALMTRSSAMLAEAFHSLADTGNQLFLLLGIKLSARPADARHPFGHSNERYFWAFIVAISIFTIGAAFSAYEGVHKLIHFRDPDQKLQHPWWGLGVLLVSVVLETFSWIMAYREVRATKRERGWVGTIVEARDPVIITVLLEDSAALAGLLTALGGLLLAWWTGNMLFDGIASVIVGLLLAGVAYVLARETKELLLGESVRAEDTQLITEVVESTPGVQKLVVQRAVHLGPEDVLAALKIHFDDTLTTHQLEQLIDEVERRLREKLPHLRRIWIEPAGERQPAD
jgi:cation diffusion facilitator family transporter